MPRTVKRYGWRPDLPDHRDQKLTLPTVGVLPSSVDLRGLCPEVYDQGQAGSCTANAVGAAWQFVALKEAFSDRGVPSRLFIYYCERDIEGTTDYDSGAQIRDGFKVIANVGVIPETEWPYDLSQLTVKPTPQCYTDASVEKALKYQSVPQDEKSVKAVLAGGLPVVFGFTVFQSFESPQVANTGVVPMPGFLESAVGGHAVMAVGYDDASQRFIVRNSWGTGWGQAGYFTFPYKYLLNADLASDLWVLQLI